MIFFSDLANWQRANVWSLLQDNEYVLSKLYASVDIFPTLLGTCGGLYVVEALEPLAFPPRYFAKLSFNQWAQRVSVTLAILDLLDELENVFEDPVHLCDVKPEHFGISDFGKVKVLDLDSVFLKSHLGNSKKKNLVKWQRWIFTRFFSHFLKMPRCDISKSKIHYMHTDTFFETLLFVMKSI